MGRFRLLPLLIGVMVLMFSVKLGNIWRDASDIDFRDGLDLQPALAQQAEEADKGETRSLLPTQPRVSSGSVLPGTGGEGVPDGAKPLRETGSDRPPIGDPNRFSEREIQLLQELAERRNVLDARERQLEEREALLRAAEQRLVEKQKELNATKTEIMSLLEKQDKQQEAQTKQLVAIYENMKPRDAANIFNELEMPVLLQVVKNMKERKVAPVIASMSTEKARMLTKELAELQEFPALPR